MRNIEVIRSFMVKGFGRSTNKNLRSHGNELVNYNTTIAYHADDKIFLNVRKYSSTTSRIQNEIKKQANRIGIEIDEYVGNPR